MKLSKEIVEEIIEDLRGSCQDLSVVCERYEIDAGYFLDNHAEDLDDQIFNCEGCGWWFEMGEMAENDSKDRWVCEDCCESECYEK